MYTEFRKKFMPDPAINPSSQNQSVASSNSKMKKFLPIIVGVIILVVLAEAGYFIYLKYLKSPSTTSAPEVERVIDVEKTRTRPPTLDALSNTIHSKKLVEFEEKFLLNFEPGFVANSYITTTLIGEVVFANEHEDEDGNPMFTVSIENETKQSTRISWNSEELKVLKVYLLKNGDNGGKEEISYKDIRERDDVAIKYVVNLLDEKGSNPTTIEIRRF